MLYLHSAPASKKEKAIDYQLILFSFAGPTDDDPQSPSWLPEPNTPPLTPPDNTPGAGGDGTLTPPGSTPDSDGFPTMTPPGVRPDLSTVQPSQRVSYIILLALFGAIAFI